MPYYNKLMMSEEAAKKQQADSKAEKKLTQNKHILFLQSATIMQCIEKKDYKCVKDICESMIKTITPSSN